METKTCAQCGLTKSLDNFPLRAKSQLNRYKTESAKYQSHCNPCARAARKSMPSGLWAKWALNVNRKGSIKISATDLRTLGYPEDNVCYLCGDKLSTSGYEIDHVVPRALGGDNELSNLRWTHKTCNRLKHDMLIADMLDLMAKIVAHVGTTN